MHKNLKAICSLKWNPFSADLPLEAVRATPAIEDFCWRIEHGLVSEGGFAMITGAPGAGKSVALRLLADRIGRLRDVTVGVIEHPQSKMADFYREMGDLFGVELRPHNRWGGFRALRERWSAHIESTMMRPVLLCDEAQEMNATVLSELRILSSTRFDSRSILGVVFAGDARLVRRLQTDDLAPLGSRIRTRLLLEPASADDLRVCLCHLMKTAGNANLMTPQLIDTLCDHALGNYRALTHMAGELLAVAAQRELSQLDEKLYFDVFAQPASPPPRRAAQARQ